MYCWRISKYDPKYRDSFGRFENDEWTSICEIGNFFNKIELTFEAYLEVENTYIEAILTILDELNITSLKIENLERENDIKDYDYVDKNMEETFNSMEDGIELATNQIIIFMKLVLREKLWGKLNNTNFFVHFGYDYYMYIGSRKSLVKCRTSIENSGLFIENIRSPYMVD